MKNKNIIIGVLAFIIVILSGYIIYDKVLLDDKTDVVDKDNLDDDKNQDNNGDNKVEDKVENNKENDVDNSENDNVGNDIGNTIGMIGEIEVEVTKNDEQVVEKITGNYKDYTSKCGYRNDIDYVKCVASYNFKSNNDYKSVVSVEDTYAIESFTETKLFILKDGNLYYNIVNCRNDDTCGYYKYDFFDESYHNNYKNLYLFKELKNIKRIKGYNDGSGVDYSLLLITDNGDVYKLNYSSLSDGSKYNNKFILSKVSELSQYYVDDVIHYRSGFEFGSTYEVVLKDGTVLTKTIDVEN